MSLLVEKDLRRTYRIGLALPARVEYRINSDTIFNEVIRLNDVSELGAGFMMQHPAKRGRLMLLTAPMPRQLRHYDFHEPQYKIWAIVRHCVPVSSKTEEMYAVGVAFVGKNAPDSYFENPCKLYDSVDEDGERFCGLVEADPNPDESNLPKEYRRHSRFQIPINVTLELTDDKGNLIKTEPSVTENLSLGGSSVITSMDLPVGSFLRFNSDQYNVSIMSIVRGKRLGADGFPRLHIEFVDRYFPLDGVE